MQTPTYTEYLSQHSIDNPLRYQRCGPFDLVLAYARSSEAVSYDEKNQDAYCVRFDTRRGVCVVADGVGQSFRGEIASSAVVQALTDVLWKMDLTDVQLLQQLVYDRLIGITTTVTQLLDSVSLEEHPVMFREALAQKRSLGSESVFCATAYDTERDTLIICWLGDCRVQIYDAQRNQIPLPAEHFVSMERWSSVRKLVGNVRFVQFRLSQIGSVALYSDGLGELDTIELGNADAVERARVAIQNNAISPRSDDSTFVRIGFR